MFNVQKREWSKQVCEYLGIEDSILPRAYESFHVTGKITKEVKKILGTEKDILVVGGAGDQAAGAVGSGTVSDGMVSINLGTSGVVLHPTMSILLIRCVDCMRFVTQMVDTIQWE